MSSIDQKLADALRRNSDRVKAVTGEVRAQLASVPEFVEDAVEKTGRHQVEQILNERELTKAAQRWLGITGWVQKGHWSGLK